MKHIVISGSMRSGTTLTASILNAHPEVALVSDKLTWFFKRVYYPNSNFNTNYRYKNLLYKMKPYMDHHKNSFTIDDVAKRLANISELDFKKLYRVLLELEIGKSIGMSSAFGIKSTHLVERYEDIIALYPETRIIHMVRDIHDVYYSHSNFAKKSLLTRMRGAVKDPKEVFGFFRRQICRFVGRVCSRGTSLDVVYKNPLHFLDIDLMVDYWVDSNSEALRLADIYPENILVMKYEDLLSNNEDSIKRILEFCSLSYHGSCFDYDKLKDRDGNKWEANSSFSRKSHGYDLTRIGRGRIKLDKATLESINYKCSAVLAELRY